MAAKRVPTVRGEQYSDSNVLDSTKYRTQTRVWHFIVADVSKANIGAEFFSHYGLLVYIRNRRLLDVTTTLSTAGREENENYMQIRLIKDATKFHELLAKFSELMQPAGSPSVVKHSNLQNIRTTPGPPVSCRACHLTPA